MLKSGDSSVYIIQSDLGGPIKIGTSASPIKRLLSLQIGSPFPLVMRWISAPVYHVAADKQIHRMLPTVDFCRGEWYWPTGEVLSICAAQLSIGAIRDISREQPERNPLAAAFHEQQKWYAEVFTRAQFVHDAVETISEKATQAMCEYEDAITDLKAEMEALAEISKHETSWMRDLPGLAEVLGKLPRNIEEESISLAHHLGIGHHSQRAKRLAPLDEQAESFVDQLLARRAKN